MGSADRRYILLGGTLVTVLLLIPRSGYIYAPMVGGFVVGVLAGTGMRGGTDGALLGVTVLPFAGVLVVVSGLFDVGTTIDLLVRSFRGMGAKTWLFYAVILNFLSIYSALVGGLFGCLGGEISTRIAPRAVAE
jgi:hypothetical protein